MTRTVPYPWRRDPKRRKFVVLTLRCGATIFALLVVVIAWRIMAAASASVDFVVAVMAALMFAYQFER